MWYKCKQFIKSHLLIKLALTVTILLSTAFFLIAPIQNGIYRLLDYHYYTLGNLAQIENQNIIAFQNYIAENKIESDDMSAIYEWNQDNSDISLILTDDTYIRYYSYRNMSSLLDTLSDYNNSYVTKELISNHTELSNLYFDKIMFANGKILFASIEYLGHYKYYVGAYYLSLIICFLLFLLPFFFLIRSKTSYIKQLAGELHILEGGNLEYTITEKGSDELYQLSHGINEMRLSILQKQNQSVENQNANHKLVTSLSHDLRTPLTSLIGYLEIMKLQKYKDHKQLQDFIQKSQEKAFLMKEMSDKLFEYFLVSQQVSEEYRMVNIPAADLVSGLVDNQIFDLENHGFTINAPLSPKQYTGYCRIDVEFMQRVLDNILSNIRKYANPLLPIYINVLEENGFFILRFENGILENGILAESTGVGLKTCEKIMQEHRGALKTRMEGNSFITKLILPIKNKIR